MDSTSELPQGWRTGNEVHTRPSRRMRARAAEREEARDATFGRANFISQLSLAYPMQPEVISNFKCFGATEQFITQCCCFQSPFTCFLLLCPTPF